MCEAALREKCSFRVGSQTEIFSVETAAKKHAVSRCGFWNVALDFAPFLARISPISVELVRVSSVWFRFCIQDLQRRGFQICGIGHYVNDTADFPFKWMGSGMRSDFYAESKSNSVMWTHPKRPRLLLHRLIAIRSANWLIASWSVFIKRRLHTAQLSRAERRPHSKYITYDHSCGHLFSWLSAACSLFTDK